MIEGITKLAISKKVDLVAIVGDLADNKYLTPQEKDLLVNWLIDLSQQGTKHKFDIVVSGGNHDLVSEEGGYTQLRSIKEIANKFSLKNMHIVETEPKLVKIKDYVYVGVVPSKYYKTEELNAITSLLYKQAKQACEDCVAVTGSIPNKLIFFVMIHETIKGASNDYGHVFSRGTSLDKTIPVTAYFLGDLHMPQIITGIPNARYSGSPAQLDFGDVGDRGVLIWDTDNINEPEFVKVEGIVPLVTLDKVPDKWPDPTEAIVRLAIPLEQLEGVELPSNVVSWKPTVEQQEVAQVEISDDLLEGLPELLAEQGLDPESQIEAVEIVKRLIE
jgi:DNA repair exonuclease SbcCD nuclease subunit